MDLAALFGAVVTASLVASVIAILTWLFTRLGSSVITSVWAHRLSWIFVARLTLPLVVAFGYLLIWILGLGNSLNSGSSHLAQVQATATIDYTSMYQQIGRANGGVNYAGTVMTRAPDLIQSGLVSPVFMSQEVANLLTFAWIFGVCLGLSIAVRSLFLTNRKLRAEELELAGPLFDQFLACKSRILPRSRVRLILSARLPGPAVYGVFNPRICLPTPLVAELDREGIDHVFTHELMHIKRGDQVLNALLVVIRIVYWFNPLIWIACRRIDQLRELACDEEVISKQGSSERLAYGQSLLRVATLTNSNRFQLTTLPMSKRNSDIRQRILQIGKPVRRHWLGFLLCFLCITLSLSGSLLHATVPIIESKQRSFLPAVFVPAGNFSVGDKDVRLSGFYMGQTEVTQRQYEIIMNKNPSWFAREAKSENRPVEDLNWFEAIEFCNKLSLKDGLDPVYQRQGDEVITDFTKSGWRLPTEAEWEYSAIGGQKSRQFEWAGGSRVDEVAWYERNAAGVPQPVATKMRNELGIFDMSGNVYEWCNDLYGKFPSSYQNPRGAGEGVARVVRGGGAGHTAFSVSLADRSANDAWLKSNNLGFRVARRQ